MAQRSAVVVGGGIVGLATAIGLGRSGWRVRVIRAALGAATDRIDRADADPGRCQGNQDTIEFGRRQLPSVSGHRSGR